jgi:hypothetical protein
LSKKAENNNFPVRQRRNAKEPTDDEKDAYISRKAAGLIMDELSSLP